MGFEHTNNVAETPLEIPYEFESPPLTADIYRAAMSELSDATSEKPTPTSTVVSKIRSRISDPPVDNVIYRVILDASKNESSPISSRKGRGGGYFLTHTGSELEAEHKSAHISEDEQEVEPQSQAEKTLEKHLWPLVTLWFKSEKEIPNATHEIANLKSGGTWGNPDVVALKPIDKFGFFEVEVTTVEVKPSLDQWRYYFFEAVSHKRFAERVYFSYRSDGSKLQDEKEIISYAEKYGVGIIRMEFDAEYYDKLANWGNMEEAEKFELIDKFVEVVPAPFDPVPLAEKIALLERLKITDRASIYKFGL